MRSFLAMVIMLAGQMNTLQPKSVVHLQAHRNSIDQGFGGSFLELINAPATVFLPGFPPKADTNSIPWTVDIKNFGPNPVTVSAEKVHFGTTISVGQTVHIVSNGTDYFLKR